MSAQKVLLKESQDELICYSPTGKEREKQVRWLKKGEEKTVEEQEGEQDGELEEAWSQEQIEKRQKAKKRTRQRKDWGNTCRKDRRNGRPDRRRCKGRSGDRKSSRTRMSRKR